jgi:PilZ domain
MPAEQRKAPRRPFNTNGFLYALDGRAIGPCHVEDVSEGGAKLIQTTEVGLPAQFTLSLSRDGRVRRQCQIVWRAKRHLGVRFIETAPR